MRQVITMLIPMVALVLAAGCGGSPCSAPTPADCGGGVCCPAGENWYCPATQACWDSLAGAQYDCGNSYQTCK